MSIKEMAKKYFLFSLVILLIAGIFASYEIGKVSHSINLKYTQGENIQGWVNMSFEDEDASSIFSDSKNSTKLIDLLKTDSRHKYSCEPSDCESYYTADSSSEQTKKINFNQGEESIIGFKLDSDLSGINSLSFKIMSNNSISSCANQIKLDFFNDGIIETGNTKVSAQEKCENQNYGCFKDDKYTTYGKEYVIDEMFCQKIKLKEAPGFFIGAWVKNESGNLNLTMEIYRYDKDDDSWISAEKGKCFLDDPSITGEEKNCSVDYLVTNEEEYYVCIYSNSGKGEYKLRGYKNIDKCGFYGNFPEETPYALQIFAIPKKFAGIGTIGITNTLSSGEKLSDLIENYLEEKYGNLDCSEEGCVIPVKIISGINQQITLKELTLSYTEKDGPTTDENNFYEVSEQNALVSADYQKIYLDKGNFSAQNETGNYTFKLKFKEKEIFSEKVEVKKTASIILITPLQTAVALPTIFKVKLESGANATKYSWDFGDGKIETTLINEASHTYNSIGQYNIIITIEDKDGTKSSKTFNIVVGSAKEVLDDMIAEKETGLLKIQGQLQTYDLFSADAIEHALYLNEIEKKLNEINTTYSGLGNSATEEKYSALLLKILEIDLPDYIALSSSSPIPLTFFPQEENINLEMLAKISKKNYSSAQEDEYKTAILGWNVKNTPVKVSVKGYSTNYGSGEETLVNVFKVEIKKLGEDAYIIIKEMENINFKDNNSMKFDSGYYYKSLSSSETIEFYTTEDISFQDLPLVISPAINKLAVSEKNQTSEEDIINKKWFIFGGIIFILLFIGMGIFFFLKKWYKEKYENYLFKNKNDLYNMVTYIQNAKVQGLDTNAIEKNLIKAKWSNEQINYVMKKYSGKKMGMLGFSSEKSENKNFSRKS